jgi:glucosylceramidase
MSGDRSRRDFLKISTLGLAATATADAWTSTPSRAQESSKSGIQGWTTAGDDRFRRLPPLAWRKSAEGTTERTVTIDPKVQFQEILGFGAAFTDASCYLFNQMPGGSRSALFRDLFNPGEMNLNVCRTCIGASDYSTSVYSFDEGDPDPELKRFSIEHDKSYILPMLREARQQNRELFLFSSPWSPPGWMKANNSMLGGSMRKKYLRSYAEYFSKFLEAYAADGVEIDAVTPQNEVDTDQDGRMPACLWGQEYEIEFVGKHLGPLLRERGLKTKIWILDHNYNLWGRAICELDDPDLRKYSSAIAWHGYVGSAEMMSKVHAAHPDCSMHWTEGGPDYTRPDYATDWVNWSETFTDALQNWCQSITGWNLVLDEKGRPNLGPFPCGGLVTLHSQSGEVTRSGQYHAMAHYSRVIRRGARRISSTCESKALRHVAFQDPEGQQTLVLTNREAATVAVVRAGGNDVEVPVPAGSITTLTWA